MIHASALRTLWCTLTSRYIYKNGFPGSRCGGNETKSAIWSFTFTEIRTMVVTDERDGAAVRSITFP